MSKYVFITGGTGYVGSRLIKLLQKRGFSIRALVRKGSAHKLPKECPYVVADPFDPAAFATLIDEGSTFIQLLGVSHPGPSKKDLFYKIDLASARASISAAAQAKCGHFVYVSVAQTPTSIMRDYQHCRAECEQLIRKTGMKATIVRPWYIVGPGHYWPLLLAPLFKLLEYIPATAAKAKALRLVYLKDMLATLVHAVENPPEQTLRIVEINDIIHSSLNYPPL